MIFFPINETLHLLVICLFGTFVETTFAALDGIVTS